MVPSGKAVPVRRLRPSQKLVTVKLRQPRAAGRHNAGQAVGVVGNCDGQTLRLERDALEQRIGVAQRPVGRMSRKVVRKVIVWPLGSETCDRFVVKVTVPR